jgi:fumarate reductase flavoprotein subunit
MAGLVAAARLRELGAEAVVYEKGTRPGGSMLLSSCVVWCHRELEEFRRECPAGDQGLQQTIWERFDDAIAWLERVTLVEPVWQDTNNPRTTGRRYDPRALTAALVALCDDLRLSKSAVGDVDVHLHHAPLILATGGFPVRLARERDLLVRSNPWSTGEGLDAAETLGAATAGDLGEFYGRAMPAPPAKIGEADFVRLAQVWAGRARVVNEHGDAFFEDTPAWHESDLAQAIARQPGGTAWYVLDPSAAREPKLLAAREAGATVIESAGEIRLHVAAAVTHTLGGIRVDERARVLTEHGSPIDGLFAAGVDVGGIASGGYASGLAQALVLGLIAAETALRQ